MSASTVYSESIPLHNSHGRRPRFGLGNDQEDSDQRAWYKRWRLWLPSSTLAKPLDSDRNSITPTKLLRPQSPKLVRESSENIEPTPPTVTAQLSQGQSYSNRGDGKPAPPLNTEKETKLLGYLSKSSSTHDIAAGLHQSLRQDEVQTPEFRSSSLIPPIHSSQHTSYAQPESYQLPTNPDSGVPRTEDQPCSNPRCQAAVDGMRSRSSSLSGGPLSDSNSKSYQYTTDKCKLALDLLYPESIIPHEGLADNKYLHRFTHDPTSTSPGHPDATCCNSSTYSLSDQDTVSTCLYSTDIFLSPKSGVVSESSHRPTTAPSIVNSLFSTYDELQPLRQPQVVSAVQEGSILNSVINAMANEAMEHYKSGLLDDSSAFADPVFQKLPIPPTTVQELEIRFITLVNTKNALLLRQLAVATDIGVALELLMPKLRLYVKDETTVATVHEEMMSIKQECLDRRLDMHFHALEHLSSAVSSHAPSFQRKIEAVNRELQPLFDKHKASRDAALRFMVDPRALIENRLGMFSMSQM